MESKVPGLKEGIEARNWGGVLGAYLASFLIWRGFGILGTFIPLWIGLWCFTTLWNLSQWRQWLNSQLYNALFILIWGSFYLGFLSTFFNWNLFLLGGGIGYYLVILSHHYLGDLGTSLILFLLIAGFLMHLQLGGIVQWLRKSYPWLESNKKRTSETPPQNEEEEELKSPPMKEREEERDEGLIQILSVKKIVLKEEQNGTEETSSSPVFEGKVEEKEPEIETWKNPIAKKEEIVFSAPQSQKEVEMEVEAPSVETHSPLRYTELHSHPFDQLEESENGSPSFPGSKESGFQFPPVGILTLYEKETKPLDQEELELNKERIVDTLRQFQIEITKIKATIGPTVTLYEIVPAPGIKVNKIRNLEDDIALSLAAEGIRIIAPIPGRGTIGIEIPNRNPQIVSLRRIIESDAFQKTDAELPLALGRTIANEVFIQDLSKMPHLLIAGATGQGKSVGINTMIVSLLFKKHPEELKFIMIDPKKVEMALYERIENHYLAAIPGIDEPIITEVDKVPSVLNALILEMEQRYRLLKEAECRNIKEYNHKMLSGTFYGTSTHRYLPYIVLIIDELADLMMVKRKEVETPIARLAQLARAVGIHLIVATQRPSVDIITGVIKANFPARIAYRVISSHDSKTILDMQGAERLIGRGDMLFYKGLEPIRIQTAFISTEEVKQVTEFIARQPFPASKYWLPEPEVEEEEKKEWESGTELDALFEEAARFFLRQKEASASSLQREFSIGFTRAGRIVDQLYKAGIIGPPNGSKPRDILVSDEFTLEQILRKIRETH
jgi:S-DNA-T family DNA segregation ATPase FtsK/SpoIIIE